MWGKKLKKIGGRTVSMNTFYIKCYGYGFFIFEDNCAPQCNKAMLFSLPYCFRLNRRSLHLWRKLMTVRRKKTPERGPSPEVQGGQTWIHFAVRSLYLSYNYKTSAFILCTAGVRRGRHRHDGGRLWKGKGSTALHDPRDANPARPAAVRLRHRWCSCRRNLSSRRWSLKYQRQGPFQKQLSRNPTGACTSTRETTDFSWLFRFLNVFFLARSDAVVEVVNADPVPEVKERSPEKIQKKEERPRSREKEKESRRERPHHRSRSHSRSRRRRSRSRSFFVTEKCWLLNEWLQFLCFYNHQVKSSNGLLLLLFLF